MKRILLISSNTTTEPYPVYPLGLAVIAAALTHAGHEVEQFDFLVSGESEELLAARITAFAPDFACISIRNLDNCDSLSVTGYPEIARRIVAIIKELSSVPVIAGGPAFSIMPEELLAYTGADYGIVGEGESLVCDLIHDLSHGKMPPRLLRNTRLLDGAEMLSPLYSEQMIGFYLEKSGMINLQTKRGCPHTCIYCSYPSLEGTIWRGRDPRSVADDLERIKAVHGVSSFFFTDSVFNDGDGHYLTIVEEIIRRNLSLRWCCYMRPEGVGRREVALMKRAGLYAVELGTDAASDTTLRALGKGFTFANALEANRACVAEQIPCAHFVMFGGPGETMATVAEGLENLKQLEHTVVFAFSGIRILPGTPLCAIAVRDGLITEATSLLEPVYYLSTAIDAEAMNDMIMESFKNRRDRIFPPSAGQERLSIMHRFGYRGLLWDWLIKFPEAKGFIMVNNKKILLVHPLGYKADAAGHDISRIANIMPPLGLASIAAYMEQRGTAVDIIDCYARPDSDRAIRDYLLAEKPAFIGLSCTTSSFLDGIRIAEMARRALPGIKTVFGGPHVSALKEQLFASFPAMDYAVIGEGEETMAELAGCGHDDPAAVKGIIYRKGSEVSFTGYREKGLELDALPFPAYEKLAGFPTSYMLPIFNYPKTPNTSCISSRGCPYSCSYCDRSVFRRSFRYNSATYLYEHLRYLKERFGIRHINFYDDQFTFNRQRVEEFTGMMIDRPLGMTFNCAVRAEHIDRELLLRMRSAGCWMMSLGIETGDEELLAQHRQNADLKHLAGKIRMIKNAGIRTKGLLMMGLPGETEVSIRRSMDYVFSLPIDDFNLAKFTPFPGSPIYDNIKELGEFEEDWEKMDCMNFLFITKGMTRERLELLFNEFYRNHFKRPKVLWGYVTMLWRSPDSWLRFLSNIANFIKFTRSSSRHMDKDD